jgi:hypothetical protein
MKYIGNFKSWISSSWRQEILSTTGQARPRDWPPINAVESAEYQKYQEAGYDLSAVNWWVYEEKDVSFKITPPWCSKEIHWWFTKLLPGQYMPMHVDPHTVSKPCKRYWMPLQDYYPGHIFVYGDEMINGYKEGDVYMFDREFDIHGSANIGHMPRVMLLITEYL